MATKIYVDHVLVHWGEDLLWDPERRARVQKSITSTPKLPRSRPTGGDHESTDVATRVRVHLQALVHKSPQVMVKITGGGADMLRIGSHIDYIARGGRYKKKGLDELEIETAQGSSSGQDARRRLKELFAFSGAPIPAEMYEANETKLVNRKRREALNMILSMPHGIAREQVKAAARQTVKELFGQNHLYAMVHHEDTPHQHTHVLVKMVGHDGVRLNPRKGDLANWRAVFAKHLNTLGIDAVATKRAVRLQRKKGESQAVRQIKDRGQIPLRQSTSVTQQASRKRAQDNDKRIGTAYSEMARALGTSDLAEDRQLASGLTSFLKEQGIGQRRKVSMR